VLVQRQVWSAQNSEHANYVGCSDVDSAERHGRSAVTSEKYLGVYLNHHFKWSHHVDQVTAKASRKLGFCNCQIFYRAVPSVIQRKDGKGLELFASVRRGS